MSVEEWARDHHLEAFLAPLMEAGFDTVEVLAHVDDADLDWMKIERPGDRKKILLACSALRSALADEEVHSDALSVVGTCQEDGDAREVRESQEEVHRLVQRLSVGSLHPVSVENPLFVAISSGSIEEVQELVSSINAGTLTLDPNELGGPLRNTPLQVAVSLQSKCSWMEETPEAC
jgi:hypothetical protein